MSRPAGVSERNASRKSALFVRRVTQLSSLQQCDRARHLGLVHVAMCADCLGGHGAEFTKGDQHAPFRHADLVAVGIDARERL